MCWIEKFLKEFEKSGPGNVKNMSLKDKKIPSKLYRYRSMEGNDFKNTFDEIIQDYVFLVKPELFRDPYDTAPRLAKSTKIERITSALDSDKIGNEVKSAIGYQEEGLIRDFGKVIRDGILLCSFTSKNDNLSMWENYAADHKGICIEYDMTQFNREDAQRFCMYPVLYGEDSRPQLNLSELASNAGLMIQKKIHASCCKGSDYRNEEEWRLISVGIDVGNKPGFKHPFPSISRIYLGSKCKKGEFLKYAANMKGIELLRMQVDYEGIKYVPE